MIVPFDTTASRSVNNATPTHLNPLQWHQSLGLARQICARVFRDGGMPADAIKAYGLSPRPGATWDKAVELIAEKLAVEPRRKAA